MELLYTSLVRPHLKYVATIWNPYLQKYIDRKGATKSNKDTFREMTYEKRLNEFKMITCEERRNRGDMLQMFRFTCLIFTILHCLLKSQSQVATTT